MYTRENRAPKNIGIDTEIVSISISVAESLRAVARGVLGGAKHL